MNPLVSILIPAYNSQEWIRETIDSALAQTWAKKEIVIVDDGSKDQTLEIARSYESKGVRVASQKNQGAAVARNTAFDLAQGDYIQWLDADDVLDPHKIENQVKVLDGVSKRTLISGAWGHYIYRLSKARFVPTPLWHDLSPVEWLVAKMGSNLHMQTDNWLVSRELTQAAGPWDVRLFRDNDGEYFSRMIVASDGVKFVPEAKSYYRNAGFKSISHIGKSNKKMESLAISMKLHIQYLRSLEYSERTRSACVRYVATWLLELYSRPDLVQQLTDLCLELGEEPKVRPLSWKYSWIGKLFGWRAGREAELVLQRVNATRVIAWDKAMHQWQSRGAGQAAQNNH
jgi:glycosyltransferase involved in cell wall biosynthesis